MFMAWVGTMKADEIVVPNIVIPKGGTAILDIQLNNEQELNRTFGLFINLPDGITVVDDSEKLGERFNGTNVSVVGTPESDGRYKILAVNGITADDDYPIPDNSGTIVTVELASDESIDEGTVLDASIENIELNLFSKETDGAPSDVPTTVNFHITIGEPDDGRIKFYEDATSLPKYTAGEKANVTMYRTIKANEWSTMVLPFNLTKSKAKAAFGDDVEMAKFTGFVVDYGEEEENVTPLGITINLTSYTIPTQGNLAGGTPILIKTSKDITEPLQFDDVKLTEGVQNVENEFVLNEDFTLKGKFRGTLVKTVVPEDGLFINGNQFWYSTGKSTAKAFRCWFELGAVLDKETDFSSRIFLHFDDSETTGISLTPSPSLRGEGSIYTLDGRKVVNDDTSNSKLRKGIYVKGGKKMIVK